MYRFLDRQISDVGEPHRFLLSAMRFWVAAARAGRCPCAVLWDAFSGCGAAAATRDFGIAMATLDRDGLEQLGFGPVGSAVVRDDEARLLGLFDGALAGVPGRVRRIAATMVEAEAVARLAIAVEWVALHLSNGIFVERD